MDENVSNESTRNAGHKSSPRRVFILTENTLVYEVEPREPQEEGQDKPTTIAIQSYIPVEIRRDRISVFFACLAAVVSAITLIVVAKYTYYAKGQWEETGRSVVKMDQAIREATRSADAAETANANAIETDRPWIGVVDSIPKEYGVNTDGGYLQVRIQNGGKRPAYVLASDMNAHWYREKDFPQPPDYQKAPTPSHNVVLPGTFFTMHSKGRLFIPSDTFKVKKEAGERFYWYGYITYLDVGTKAVHYTDFCFVFIPERDGFYNCSFYNTAD